MNQSNNTKIYATPYLLSGLIFCKHCGKSYETNATQRSDGKRHSYYCCRNKHGNKKEKCIGVTYSQEIIEKIEEMLKEFASPDTIKKVKKRLDEQREIAKVDLNSIKKQLAEKEKEALNLASEIANLKKSNESNKVKLEIYKKREDMVYDEIFNLRKSLDELNKQSDGIIEEDYDIKLIKRSIRDFTDVFSHSSSAKQRTILESLIHKIIVDKECKVEITFNWGNKGNGNDDVISSEKIGEGANPFISSEMIGEGIVSTIGSVHTHAKVLENPDMISQTVLAKGLDSGTAFEILSIDIADVDIGKNIGAELQIEQAEADKNIAQAKAEERRAMAVANEQEMIARVQEMKAKVVEAEAEVPMAIAEALRSGNFGIMDYMNYKNIQADTSMRDSIAKVSQEKPDAGDK